MASLVVVAVEFNHNFVLFYWLEFDGRVGTTGSARYLVQVYKPTLFYTICSNN